MFELCGLGMKRVVDGSGERRGLVHEPRWVKRSLSGQGDDEVHHLLVTHHDYAEVARFSRRNGDSGTRVCFASGLADLVEILGRERITDLCWFWRPGDGSDDVTALRAECERNYRDLLDLLAAIEKAGFGRNQRLWLITENAVCLPGDDAGTGPSAAASLWGFGHSLLNEYPSYQATMVDLATADDRVLLLAECHARGGEFQIAYRGGQRHVRRLFPVDLHGLRGRDHNFELAIKEYGQFANIRVMPTEDILPVGDQIQVSVQAAGLNFKDVLTALGMLKDFGDQPLGFEAAGTVVAAGPAAGFAVGDEVIVNYLGCMKRRVTVPSAMAVRKPVNVDVTQAAGLASGYVTAYYALHVLAGVKAGDKVLIHAAAGGVGQAAVHLAKAVGAEVFATASPHKWPLLRAQGIEHTMNSRTLGFADEIAGITAGAGVDIVLNSLNKDFIEAGMRSLAHGGRFIEMGKVGVLTPEQVREIRPDATYHNFDLSELPEAEMLRLNSEIMGVVVDRVAKGELPPLTVTRYSLDEIEEAFGVLSRGANIGKLVLGFVDEHALRRRDVTVDRGHTYLVTGGFVGLGLVSALKLVELGARHIALVSRRTEPSDEVAELVERLRAKAEVTIHQGDIGGMSARLDGQLIKRWEDEGITLTTPRVGTRVMTSLLDSPIRQAVVGKCDWDRFATGKPAANALYQPVVLRGGAESRGLDLDALIAAPKRERTAAIGEFVRGKVAAVLHFDGPDAVDSTTEFVRLGLDSLVAVELKNSLEAAFQIPLPASVAFDHPSAGQLAEFLERQLVPESTG